MRQLYFSLLGNSLGHAVAKTLLQAQPLNENNEAVGDAFACVLSDSDTESQFAHDCSVDERVKFFFKLPGKFKISTPLGTYDPDWAVVFKDVTSLNELVS